MNYNIAIDGPAGAGKSTIAKKLAKKYGYIYVDTGSLYRAITLYILNNSIDYNNEENVESVLDKINIEIKYIDSVQRVFLNDEDITNFLRTEEVSNATSVVATYSKVREKLVSIQRKIASSNKVVMDGRDITSVVLPNADLKIYLDATVEERAKRRFIELNDKSVDLEKIKEDIITRDNRDMTREISPLKRVDDAIYIDASNLGIEEVVEEISKLIK